MTDQPYPPLRPQPPVRPRRRETPWPMITGVVVLAVLAGVLLVILLGGDDEGPSGAASPDATAPGSTATAGSATASASPGGGASASAAPSSGTATLAPDTVVSLAVDALALRDEPGLAGEVQWRLPEGALAFVIAGPADADGLPWYQVSGMGLPYASGCVTPEPGELNGCPAFIGWVAGSGSDGVPYLTPTSGPDCAPPPHSVVSLSEQQYTLHLICFDAEPLTFRAWWPELPDDPGPGGSCAAAETEIGWLVCQNVNANALGASPDDPGGRLTVSIDPAGGLTMPERGQWVEVTGHFDDPTARRCGEMAELMDTDGGELVYNCRLQFVLGAVAPADGP